MLVFQPWTRHWSCFPQKFNQRTLPCEMAVSNIYWKQQVHAGNVYGWNGNWLVISLRVSTFNDRRDSREKGERYQLVYVVCTIKFCISLDFRNTCQEVNQHFLHAWIALQCGQIIRAHIVRMFPPSRTLASPAFNSIDQDVRQVTCFFLIEYYNKMSTKKKGFFFLSEILSAPPLRDDARIGVPGAPLDLSYDSSPWGGLRLANIFFRIVLIEFHSILILWEQY